MRKKIKTLSDMMNLFLDDKEGENASPATIKYYAENFERFLKFFRSDLEIENPVITDFTVENINKYRTALKKKHRWEDHPEVLKMDKKDKLADNTFRTYIRAIRTLGNWLYIRDHIEVDILKYIKLPKEEKKDIKMLSDQEALNIFSSFNFKDQLGLRDYLICRFAYDYGFRVKSIVEMKLSKIDLIEGTIEVWLKGNKWQTYRIGKEMKKKLIEYIHVHRAEMKSKSDSLFLNINGQTITDNTIKQLFKRLKEKLGIDKLSAHYLRHNFATNYLLMGHHKEELRFHLGHTTTEMSDHYDHIATSIKYVREVHDSKLDRIENKTKERRRVRVS